MSFKEDTTMAYENRGNAARKPMNIVGAGWKKVSLKGTNYISMSLNLGEILKKVPADTLAINMMMFKNNKEGSKSDYTITLSDSTFVKKSEQKQAIPKSVVAPAEDNSDEAW